MITVVEKKNHNDVIGGKKNTISQINLISLHVNRFWHIQQTKDTYVHGDWKSFQPQVYQNLRKRTITQHFCDYLKCNQSKLVTHKYPCKNYVYIDKIQIQI